MSQGHTPLGAAPMEPPAKAPGGCAYLLVALPCLLGGVILLFVTAYLATFPGCPPEFHGQNLLSWGVGALSAIYLVALAGVVVGARRGFGGRSAAWTALAILAAVAALVVPLVASPFFMPMC